MKNELISFSDDDVLRNPFPSYTKLQAVGPVLWDEFEQAWLVIGHAEAKRLARDSRLSAEADRSPIVAALPPEYADVGHRLKEQFESWMLFSDDPRHTMLRSQVAPALSTEAVEPHREALRERARELLDQAGDTLDVVEDYAMPLATLNLAQILGVPEDMVADGPRWADEIVKFINIDFVQKQAVEGQAVKTARVIDEMAELLDEMCSRGVEPGSSGAVLVDGIAAGALDRNDAEGVIGQLVSGVLGAQPYLIGNLAIAMWRDTPVEVPEYDPADVTEEILRFDPSFMLVPRTAVEDIEIGGVTIRAGDRIGILLAAVNRDTRIVSCPHDFDPGRDRKTHMSFGNGAHYCLGSNMVRVYTQVASEELLTAFPPAAATVSSAPHVPYFGTRVPQEVRLRKVAT